MHLLKVTGIMLGNLSSVKGILMKGFIILVILSQLEKDGRRLEMESILPAYLKATIILLVTFYHPISTGTVCEQTINKHHINTKGVLDRWEDNDMAVLLVEGINKEIVVSRDVLPRGSEINMWFDLELNGNTIVAISIDWQITIEMIKQTQELMKELRR